MITILQIVLIKFPIYLTLLFLAISCIELARSNTPMPQFGCRCKNTALILKIVGCGTISLAVHYEPSFPWVILSMVPLILGTALWDLTSSVEIHHRIDKWVTSFKQRIYDLRHRNDRDEERSVSN